ncbi:MAG: GTP-binding protein [Hyphomicrobiales bacterium]|nr:MAG: GTP-binding protein [Hyphomicrobiales bacterium]
MIPTHILTGYLGSGKTTLLNRALKAPEMENTLVVVNEFGEIGLDHLLMENSSDAILELSNGCICCMIRGELVDTLLSLKDRKFDRLIIETTGLADPAPVAQALIGHPTLSQKFDLQSIITMVDCITAFPNSNEEIEQQIAFADKIIISKADLLSKDKREATIEECKQHIQAINPNAELILATDIDDPAKIFLQIGKPVTKPVSTSHSHHHVKTITLHHEAPMPSQILDQFMEQAILRFGDDILRIKGLAYMTEHPDQPLVVHGVQNIFHQPKKLDQWPNKPQTALVIITKLKNPEPIQRLFATFLNQPQIDTPDRAAMTESPLTILGT